MKSKRWQDWLNLLLGAWLFVSPWVMRYADPTSHAAWNAWLLGAAIVIFAAVAVSMPKAWEEAVNIALGVWLVVSPWALRFSDQANVRLNAVIVGLLVMALAIWAMVLDPDFERWRHHKAAS